MSNKRLKHAAIFMAFVLGSGLLFSVTLKSIQKARSAADPLSVQAAEPEDSTTPAVTASANLPEEGTVTLSALPDAVPITAASASDTRTTVTSGVIDDGTPVITPSAASGPEAEGPAEAGVGYADGEELVVTARTSLTLKKSGDEHAPFFHGYEDGSFKPDGTITRAEGSQILYNLLSDEPFGRARLNDVAKNAWYYDAVASLASYGVIDVTDGKARPSDPMTRGEFVSALAYFFPGKITPGKPFPDVAEDYPYYGAVQKAAALGWINGYGDGTFRPDGTITRAEAATVMNRALNRTADTGWIDAHVEKPLYTDLTPEHWAYYTVMEATMAHTAGGKPEHWASVEGYAPDKLVFTGLDFHVEDGSGRTLKNVGWGKNLTFGADGNYTSGDADVDAMVKSILYSITSDDMSREDKLRAAFLYVRDGFFYRRNNFYEVGETGWELEEGRTMLTKGKGNCYNYTAAFCLMARQLGYDAGVVSGLVGEELQQHGWVEIPSEDGSELLIYDTTLENTYVLEDPKWNLFFFGLSYDDVPWPYVNH